MRSQSEEPGLAAAAGFAERLLEVIDSGRLSPPKALREGLTDLQAASTIRTIGSPPSARMICGILSPTSLHSLIAALPSRPDAHAKPRAR